VRALAIGAGTGAPPAASLRRTLRHPTTAAREARRMSREAETIEATTGGSTLMESTGTTRRQWLTLAGAGAALLATRTARAETSAPAPAPSSPTSAAPTPYQLPALPWDAAAMEGFLSREIVQLHHGAHHKGYVDGLNKTLADMADARARQQWDALKGLERNLAFHGAGHLLHTLYWNSLSPSGGGAPTPGRLRSLLERDFGSVDLFRAQFAAAAKAAEASSWALLVWEPVGARLLVTVAENHQNMQLPGAVPLLALDLWEHAYYLKYTSKRAAYVDKFFEVVDWAGAAARLPTGG